MAARIEKLGSTWPWPRVSEARKAGDSPWFESTAERWEYGLGVVPPVYFRGGFFVGEESDHDRRGVPVYAAWVQRGERFFVREVVADKVQEAVAELDAALAAEAA